MHIKSEDVSKTNPIKLIDEVKSITRRGNVPKSGSEARQCAWSSDNAYFAWSCGNNIVKVLPWNSFKNTTQARNGENERGEKLDRKELTIDCKELVWSLAFSPHSGDSYRRASSVALEWLHRPTADKVLLAIGLQSGGIRLYDVIDARLILQLIDHRDVVYGLAFSPFGGMLASASRDGKLKFWDMFDHGNLFKTLQGPSKNMYSCTWSRDAKRIVSTGDARTVTVWEMDTFKRTKLEGHHHDVIGCAFSLDGALLATASRDTSVIVWDAHTYAKLRNFSHMNPPPSSIYAGGANDHYVWGMSFCRDGLHISTICEDGTLNFWSMTAEEATPTHVVPVSKALCCEYSPDGAMVAVGNRYGDVSFWLPPLEVSSLQHLCRMVVRRVTTTDDVDRLPLPASVKSYLQYQA